MKPDKLYKTTIIIWSEYDPSYSVELEDLAREATSGDAYCSEQSTIAVTDKSQFPNTEFFDDPDNDPLEDLLTEIHNGLGRAS